MKFNMFDRENERMYEKLEQKGFVNCSKEELLWVIEYLKDEAWGITCELKEQQELNEMS